MTTRRSFAQCWRGSPPARARPWTAGEGWRPIIAQLDRDIAAVESAYEVHQVKEKFGGLRFYYAGGTSNGARIDELIAQAERLAAQTCELRGAPGRARGWIRTV